VMRIAIDLSNKLCHMSELRIVRADMNVKIIQVQRRRFPPVLRVVRSIVVVADDRGLAILRSSGPVEVEAVEPYTCAVEHLSCMVLVFRFGGNREVEIEIGGNSKVIHVRWVCKHEHKHLPDSKAEVQPAPLLLPTFHRHGVQAHQNVRSTHLDVLGAANESVPGSGLSMLHGQWVKVRALRIEPRSDRADWGECKQSGNTGLTMGGNLLTVNKKGLRQKVLFAS
jgi:hypothetical protein